MTLEATYPFGRPEHHPRADAMGEVGLRWTEICDRPVFLLVELTPNKVAPVEFEAEDRGVSDHWILPEDRFVGGDPVVNDGDLVLVSKGEKIIQRASDDDIEIEEKRESLDGQIVAEETEFSPASDHFRRREIDLRDRVDSDGRVDSSRVVGEAYDGDWCLAVPPGRGCQTINIFRAIAGSPFQGYDVAGHSRGRMEPPNLLRKEIPQSGMCLRGAFRKLRVGTHQSPPGGCKRSWDSKFQLDSQAEG